MNGGFIYLDYNATTPIAPEVADAMEPFLRGMYGNPSSTHRLGLLARQAVERARGQVAALLGCAPDEVVFTSGGSEANNAAILGTARALRDRGRHIVTSAIEHPAVTEVCRFLEEDGYRVTQLPVDGDGLIDPAELDKALARDTILVTIMHANNEVGTLQPIAELARIAHARGVRIHSDGAQSVGKVPTRMDDLGVDLFSIAGHKLYAPKGIGALYIRRGTRLAKFVHGADHEMNRRAGTENTLEIVGLGQAAEIALRDLEANHAHLRAMRDRLHETLAADWPDLRLNGHHEKRLPNTLSVSFPGLEASTILDELEGVAASAGAACHADQIDVSHVLAAMHVPLHEAMGTIRFSVGRETTPEQIDAAAREILAVTGRLRAQTEDDDSYTEPGLPHVIGGDREPASAVMASAEHEAAVKDTAAPASAAAADTAEHGKAVVHGAGSGGTAGTSREPSGSDVRLTRFTHGLGCACKIRPQTLEEILRRIPQVADENLLVGTDSSDDAAVYRIGPDLAIVGTLDFFTPIVDDPRAFGAIAAANALSDIYAMGARPIFALNIVGFPVRRLPTSVLEEILAGAADTAASAGIPIVGGHSVEDTEPKFGWAVTGLVDPKKVLANNTAQPGDLLILTKPLGLGILATAAKRGVASPTAVATSTRVMVTLSRSAAECLVGYPVSACTDITGFGLLGHLLEMTRGSRVSAELWAAEVPIIAEARQWASAGIIPGGTRNNHAHTRPHTRWDAAIPEVEQMILCDAQTSGGLLISIPAVHAENLLEDLHAAGVSAAMLVGRVGERGDGTITVVPTRPADSANGRTRR